jgi:hypothetical protein
MTPIRANIVGTPGQRHQDQRLHGRLPLRGLMLGFRKLGDVLAGLLDEGDELATAWQRYCIIIKGTFRDCGAYLRNGPRQLG